MLRISQTHCHSHFYFSTTKTYRLHNNYSDETAFLKRTTYKNFNPVRKKQTGHGETTFLKIQAEENFSS